MSPLPIRLVLADPHPLVLDGVLSQLQSNADMHVCACVHDGDAAIEALRHERPDVLVMELDLPRRNGLDLIRAIADEGMETQVVVFTAQPMREVVRALDLGVRGLVSKQRSGDSLVQCIRQVHAGNACLDPELTMKTVSLLLGRDRSEQRASQRLTPREVDVARMVTQGWPNKKIASKLAISEGTAKLHLHHIYQKLNCPGRMALMLYMQQHGE